MAESTPTPTAPAPSRPPALPSTADAIPYVPVSWMAVAAILVAGLFVLMLIGYAAYAVLGKRPLVALELLIPAVIAWVLSFAGRRIIRNSEGTRTGESLTNAAWWIAVVVGCGYGAYLLAINFTIRRDADSEVQKWMALVLKEDTTRAFHRTLEPGRRAAIDPDDATKMKLEFRNEFVGFQGTDVVRIVQRNPGACEYIPGGLREWNYRRTAIECAVTGTLKCKEGIFPLMIPLRGVEGSSEGAPGRQWQIIGGPNGFVQRDRITLTPYGWQIYALEKSADDLARIFVTHCMNTPLVRLQAVARYTKLPEEKELREVMLPYVAGAAEARVAAIGGAAVAWTPPASAFTATTKALYRLPGGQKPSEEKDKLFEEAWRTMGIGPPGSRLRDTTDVHGRIVMTDSYVEVHLPVEIPMSSPDPVSLAAARGRLVFVCTDPSVPGMLKKLRDEANPDQGTATPPDGVRWAFTWRVDRLESDMTKVILRSGGPPPPPSLPAPPGQ